MPWTDSEIVLKISTLQTSEDLQAVPDCPHEICWSKECSRVVRKAAVCSSSKSCNLICPILIQIFAAFPQLCDAFLTQFPTPCFRMEQTNSQFELWQNCCLHQNLLTNNEIAGAIGARATQAVNSVQGLHGCPMIFSKTECSESCGMSERPARAPSGNWFFFFFWWALAFFPKSFDFVPREQNSTDKTTELVLSSVILRLHHPNGLLSTLWSRASLKCSRAFRSRGIWSHFQSTVFYIVLSAEGSRRNQNPQSKIRCRSVYLRPRLLVLVSNTVRDLSQLANAFPWMVSLRGAQLYFHVYVEHFEEFWFQELYVNSVRPLEQTHDVARPTNQSTISSKSGFVTNHKTRNSRHRVKVPGIFTPVSTFAKKSPKTITKTTSLQNFAVSKSSQPSPVLLSLNVQAETFQGRLFLQTDLHSSHSHCSGNGRPFVFWFLQDAQTKRLPASWCHSGHVFLWKGPWNPLYSWVRAMDQLDATRQSFQGPCPSWIWKRGLSQALWTQALLFFPSGPKLPRIQTYHQGRRQEL